MEPTVTLSAGVVVVRFDEDTPRFLLLRTYRHWDFPKGIVEQNETPLAAARREVGEETGLDDLDFRWGEVFLETEPYGRGKVARYYLAVASRREVRLDVNPEIGRPEHDEFRWLTYEAARPLLNERIARVLEWASFVIGTTRDDFASGAR